MWVRSIVKGSIPRTGDDIRLSGRALDRDRRVALRRLPELALQYPARGFPGLRLKPNFHPEAIPAVRYAASHCRSSPGQAPSGLTGRSIFRASPNRAVSAVDAARRDGYSTPHPAGVNMLRKATFRAATDARMALRSATVSRPRRSADRGSPRDAPSVGNWGTRGRRGRRVRRPLPEPACTRPTFHRYWTGVR